MAKYRNQKKKQQQRKEEKRQELIAQGKNPDEEPKVQKKVKPEFYANLQERPEDYFVNPMFENYYKIVLKNEFKDEEEFKAFWAILKEKLPVTFRISQNIANFENYQKKLLKGKEYIKQCAQESEKFVEQKNQILEEKKKQGVPEEYLNKEYSHFKIDDVDTVNLFPVSYFPGNLTFQLDLNKQQLRKGGVLKAFHSELQKATESGIATRQELVSMFPPVLLDPQPTDKIFDMCAAPGSKTSQLLELMSAKAKSPKDITGCVIANDVDTNRAYMLTHQIDRNSTSGMMVVNHQAQFFPQLYLPQNQEQKDDKQKKQKLLFDKVLADVPCTGDGAVRKITKKFQDWNTREAFSLYPIQLSILMRAIQLCKVGGTVMYSTCSINPIEDEAVVTEALRRALPNSLELVDCHSRLPGFKGRPGLYNWPVVVSKLRKKQLGDKSVEEIQKLTNEEMFNEIALEELGNIDKALKAGDNQYSQITKDMYPESEEIMKKWGMEKTMRIMPHDQNTGGFYLCLIKKKSSKVFVPGHVFDPKKIDEPLPEEYTKDVAEQEEQEIELQAQQDQEAIKEVDNKADVEGYLQKEKVRHIVNEEDKMEEEGKKEEKNEGELTREEIKKAKKQQQMEEKFEDFGDITEEDYKEIEESYGLVDFPKHLLQVGNKGAQKNVRLITPSIHTIMKSDQKKQMNLINCGSRVFRKESEKEGQFKFRLCNDGIKEVFPYMTKRKLKISLANLKAIISKQNIKFNEIEDKEFVKTVEDFGLGSCALYIEENGVVDCFVAQIFKASIQVMMSKECIRGYDVIYSLGI